MQLDRDKVSYISGNYDPLIANGQMTLIDTPASGRAEIVPGISIEVCPAYQPHDGSDARFGRQARLLYLRPDADQCTPWIQHGSWAMTLIRWRRLRKRSAF